MYAGHCAPSPNSFGDHQCPGCPALPLTQSIQGVMSLYLMSAYSVPRSQFCFNQVTDYVSRSLLSIPQFIWGSSVPRLPGSATDTIYTRCDVTVPDVSVFRAQKSILVRSGDLLCKQVTALHPPIHLGIISAPVVSANDTIYTRCDVTVPDVSVFHAKKSILVRSGDLLCKQVTALHPPIHLGTISAPVARLCH